MMIKTTTKFWESYFHTPSEFASRHFDFVLRAGHLTAARDYRVERRICSGHDLLYCLRGHGTVTFGGSRFSVGPGQLAWIDGHHPHAHQAEPSDPWELLWMRADGLALEGIGRTLGVHQNPVFSVSPAVENVFRNILVLLRELPTACEARIHAEIASLLAYLFEERHTDEEGGAEMAQSVKTVVEQMGIYFYRNWSSADLASLARMSVPNFFRSFRRSTGLSPLKWLRLRRINEAKRRLVESRDSVKEIAEQVGYSDQFYFSRDFHKHTGISPSEFRRRETGLSPQKPLGN
jgi:AraC-like DNA-binding protein/quercetin dioxygenase-like cupin family protein